MAFGFSPKYIQDIAIENLSNEQFLVLIAEAAKQLGWSIGYTSHTGLIAYTSFSLSSYSEEVQVKIDGESATLKSECVGSQMVDWGKNKKNIEELIATYEQLKGIYTDEQLAEKYAELSATIAPDEENLLNKPPATIKEKFTGFLGIFKPAPGFFIAPILIDINIAIFILMCITGVNIFLPDNNSMIQWGANFGPMTLSGEWWRIITSCFLHFGIFHLLFNMYALLYIGLLLEPYLGKARFAAAYLLTGIAASITSLFWHSTTISAGASGAIFGMYGVFLAMLTTNLIEKSARKALLTSIVVFVGYNLMNGMKAGIDNAAHIGGLLSGIVVGYVYTISLKKPEVIQLKYISIAALTVLILSSSVIVYKKIPNDLGLYDEKMKTFVANEEKALKIYTVYKDAPTDTILAEIKNHSINYWNENIQLVKEADKLDVPPEALVRDKMLIRYCNFRIKSYNFIYKAIRENTEQYKDSIENYNKQIESIIDSLKAK